MSTVLSNSEALDIFLVSLAMHSRAVECNEAAFFLYEGKKVSTVSDNAAINPVLESSGSSR